MTARQQARALLRGLRGKQFGRVRLDSLDARGTSAEALLQAAADLRMRCVRLAGADWVIVGSPGPQTRTRDKAEPVLPEPWLRP